MKQTFHPGAVPEPPHPTDRKERLPGEVPDLDASDDARNTARILRSSAYVPATEDVEFLQGSDARGVRLQLDYLKPELAMRAHGIENTIVVFGGTRITEQKESQHRVDRLQRELDADPGNAELLKKLAVARRLLQKCEYYEVAREFSRLVAESGGGQRTCVCW